MPIALILGRFYLRLVEKAWKVCLAIEVALFVVGWLAVVLFEPADSAIRVFGNYWWWFLQTVTTVGYGEFPPHSQGARLVGLVIMILGIASLTVILTEIGVAYIALRRKMMTGEVAHTLTNHIVILGYRPGVTEDVVAEIEADPRFSKVPIVLCFDPGQANENPLPHRVRPVKGTLTSDDVMERAAVPDAAYILVDVDDNQSVGVALAAHHAQRGKRQAHMVVTVDSPRLLPEAKATCKRIGEQVEVVLGSMPDLIVTALTNPGAGDILEQITSNRVNKDVKVFDLVVPAGKPTNFSQLSSVLLREGATLLGVASDTERLARPANDFVVEPGMRAYYMASEPVEVANLRITGAAEIRVNEATA